MKNNQSSDLGFIIFLVFAGIILIPLYFGVSDISELIRIGKIVLIIVIVLVVGAIGVIGYLFYRKKVKNLVSKKKKDATKDTEQESSTKIRVKENENVTIVLPSKEEMEDGFLLNDDQIVGDLLESIKHLEEKNESPEIDGLEELNKKFKL